jgi:hypothetical protein
LVSLGGPHALSAGGPAGADSAEDSPHARSNNIAHAGVAGTAVAYSSDAPCEPIATSRAEPERSLGRAQSFESEMEITAPRDEHALPRICGALSFARLAAHVDVHPEPLTVAPISDIAVPSDVRDGLLTAFSDLSTPGARRVRELVAWHAWQSRTVQTRGSQWKCYLSLCDQDCRSVIPVTESHLLAYIGWLADEKDANRRAVAPASLAQYLSAVRVMHQSLTGLPLPDMPMVAVAARAYGHWYEEDSIHIPRLGVPAHVALAVWRKGMDATTLPELRTSVTVMLAFVLGLRESSALSILSENVALTADALTVRLSMSKGRVTRTLPPAVYRRVSASVASPVDLFMLWHRRRDGHARWLALAPEAISPTLGALTHMLRAQLLSTALAIDPDGYSSHSLRIGSHTEQVLLHIPLEVRKARFGWGPNSPMEAVYFDRSIRLSAASTWFFGPSSSFPL